jgi:hypothetical protein
MGAVIVTLHRRGRDDISSISRLERSYRWLLRAFPAHYRRHRGEEMLATLLDGAPPDRSRPSPREAVTLVAAGLRCRLSLRRGPATAVAATMAAVTGAILTGMAAAWFAWWSAAPPLPDPQEAAAIARAAVPQDPTSQVRFSFLFGEEGYDYSAGSVQFAYPGQQRGDQPSPLVTQAREQLRATGWSVGALEFTPPPPGAGYSGYTRFVGYNGGVQIIVDDADDTATVRLSRAEPAIVPILTVAGVVLGGLIGWLTAAMVSRRVSRRPLAVRAAVLVLSAVTFGALFPACLFAFPPVIRGYLNEGQPEPPWGSLTLPAVSALTAVGVGSALVVVILALAARGPAQPRLDMTTR